MAGCSNEDQPSPQAPSEADAAAVDGAGPAARPPNIIVVQTDDQTAASMTGERMPHLARALRRGGARFTEHVATTPLCCPSRASLLTGQYAHNHGIHSNRPGYPHLRDKQNVLPAWLGRAGYRTAHIGKFLHGFEQPRPGAEGAPGWDRWIGTPHRRAYFNYELNEDGRRRSFGQRRDHYLTRVLNRKARRFVRSHARGRRPLFLSLDHYAPHHSSREGAPPCDTAATPDPADARGVLRERLPARAALDEADVSDKPSFVRGLSRLRPRELRRLADDYRCDAASLRAVDRGIGALRRELRRAGQLRRTVILFTSDNGYMYGEHRIAGGKGRPYEEALRVPLAIIGPPRLVGRGGRTIDEPTANIDLAPTILDFADAPPCLEDERCRRLDGRSLRPLLRDHRAGWPQERAILIENLGSGNRNRVGGRGRSCVWTGLRTERLVYIEHLRIPHPRSTPERPRCVQSPEVELYDLRDDRAQLRNRADGGAAPSLSRLRERLARLRDCRGTEARAGQRAAPCE